ncbi:MBL fold metallo-hydrolase [Paenibacillus sp. NPDC058071]|uniref:MBL fold metallo-hydrolase n=1 Tax=Paenibacillus sp. NPDC058071 TaxID=3346326 RepID=UPI0036DD48D3
MRIANQIEMLELDLGIMVVHPVIVFDETGWVLIDTGMPGSAQTLFDQAKQAGVAERLLTAVLLTHQDLDHIGGLPGIVASSDTPPVIWAHPADEGAINGTEPFQKISREQLFGMLQSLPDNEARVQFEQAYPESGLKHVHRTFTHGDKLPFGGGLTVIHTPGHTPGHVSFYHHASKTLIAGDAMVANDGVLEGPNPQMTPDLDQALDSLKALIDYDIEQVVCYHGGLIQGGVNERIAKLADRS